MQGYFSGLRGGGGEGGGGGCSPPIPILPSCTCLLKNEWGFTYPYFFFVFIVLEVLVAPAYEQVFREPEQGQLNHS